MHYAIWSNLYNLKNEKNNHGGVLYFDNKNINALLNLQISVKRKASSQNFASNIKRIEANQLQLLIVLK